MQVSRKSQYALRALLELACRFGEGPIKVALICRQQKIPQRFLEVILSELKQGGFVDSKRGSEGGYWLARPPVSLTVGEVMQFLEGSFGPVVEDTESVGSALVSGDVLRSMWNEVGAALSSVYDGTTFQDLAERQQALMEGYVPNYSI